MENPARRSPRGLLRHLWIPELAAGIAVANEALSPAGEFCLERPALLVGAARPVEGFRNRSRIGQQLGSLVVVGLPALAATEESRPTGPRPVTQPGAHRVHAPLLDGCLHSIRKGRVRRRYRRFGGQHERVEALSHRECCLRRGETATRPPVLPPLVASVLDPDVPVECTLPARRATSSQDATPRI